MGEVYLIAKRRVSVLSLQFTALESTKDPPCSGIRQMGGAGRLSVRSNQPVASQSPTGGVRPHLECLLEPVVKFNLRNVFNPTAEFRRLATTSAEYHLSAGPSDFASRGPRRCYLGRQAFDEFKSVKPRQNQLIRHGYSRGDAVE